MASHGTVGNSSSAGAMCQTKREICFNTINPTIPHSNEQEIAAICGCVSLRFAPTVLQHPAKVRGANRLAAASCGRVSHRLSVTVRRRFKAVASHLTFRKRVFLCACVTLPPPPPTHPPSRLHCPSLAAAQQPLALQIQPLISDLGGCLTGGGEGGAGCVCASVHAQMRTDLYVGRVGASWRCRGGEFMTGPLLLRH